jgi:2-C-methyl-D-erythritol 4-phosphate cytidylyltransferase
MPDDPLPDARFFALVAAAGTGSRLGSPLAKQYVAMHGRSLLAHTLTALAEVERLALVLVALAPSSNGGSSSLHAIDSSPRAVAARRGPRLSLPVLQS